MSALDRAVVSRAVRAFLDELRPSEPKILAKLDYGFTFHRQSVELFEIRPRFNKSGTIQSAFAKATFVKAREAWKVYWRRGNGTWFPYDPSTVGTLDAVFRLVKEDRDHCFFG